MSEIIGATYEVITRIGSGGGGVVYLANHLRLNKQVVLKADKRQITVRPELLRREVDVLKNLNHPYIPQVYDFFVENGTVYTVMDYVDGESLDKALKRGARFTQPQVIRWAKQLLEALAYLHSPTHGQPPRGYVHSDIKPANIMLRENGDICLIDFNISLALGEENVIGASPGYASPEHYGLDFSISSETATQEDRTLPMDEDTATVTMQATQSSYKRKVVPDTRSDIYSTGATLYHLLSGRRPEKDALQVTHLSGQEVSPQIADIIAKAMEPNADLRYQTAEEMLWAFRHLRENDPRTKRHKRTAAVTAAVLAAVFLAGAACSMTGLRRMEQAQQQARLESEAAEARERAAKEALAAVSQSETAYQGGDRPAAVRLALQAMEMDTPYRGRAQKALTDALGVYDLSAGFKAYMTAVLPGAPIKLALSPAGTRAAALTSGLVSVYDTHTGERLAQLKANPSALSDLVFSDDNTLLYAGEEGLCAYGLSDARELWRGEPATGIAFAQGGAAVAAVCKDDAQAQVYDVSSGELLRTVDFGGQRQRVAANDIFADPEDEIFAIDAGGRWLAASFEGGSLWVYNLEGGEDLELFDRSDYTHFEGAFWEHYLAFAAAGGSEAIFVVIDMATLEQTGGFSSTMPFHVQTDEGGIYVSTEDVLVRIDPETGDQTETAYTSSKDILAFDRGGDHTAVLTQDGAASIFDKTAVQMDVFVGENHWDMAKLAGGIAVLGSGDSPTLQILRLEDYPERMLLTYDVNYSHDEARVSSDGTTAMLFRYDGFRIYDRSGALLAETMLPDAEQVYDQQFRRESGGDCLEVIYNSGLVRRYSAETGRLISETPGEVPDKTLYEEFETDSLKITSPLHGTPAAYDRETGELIRELEPDAYLTYVTQAGGYVITEYVGMQGERYGLLLDENCDTLAYLPQLCDILPDGTLVFDDMKGSLRTSPIYSAQELAALGGA